MHHREFIVRSQAVEQQLLNNSQAVQQFIVESQVGFLGLFHSKCSGRCYLALYKWYKWLFCGSKKQLWFDSENGWKWEELGGEIGAKPNSTSRIELSSGGIGTADSYKCCSLGCSSASDTVMMHNNARVWVRMAKRDHVRLRLTTESTYLMLWHVVMLQCVNHIVSTELAGLAAAEVSASVQEKVEGAIRSPAPIQCSKANNKPS